MCRQAGIGSYVAASDMLCGRIDFASSITCPIGVVEGSQPFSLFTFAVDSPCPAMAGEADDDTPVR